MKSILRTFVMIALSASVLAGVIGTLHWPIVGDAPLMHYVAFLIDHGKVPYKDIIDINMPGTYALEWGAIHLLGPGAMGWRIFDFLLLAVCGAAMMAIAWPVDWLAGFFAAALFALMHFRDGPTHTGQRDLMMTAMVLVACAAMLYAVRRERVWAAAVLGIFAGMGAVIKPTGVLFAAALGILLWMRLRALGRPAGKYLMVAAGGFSLPLLACSAYLARLGAVGAFIETNRGIVAYHASLGRPSLLVLVVGSFPSVLLAIAIPAIPLLVVSRYWKQWEGQVLLTCATLGAISYILQGKGFPYHRYPVEAFLLVICAVLLMTGLEAVSWVRIPALVGVLLGAAYLAPVSASVADHFDGRNLEFNNSLAADLGGLGGQSLEDKVQCVDMTAGCLDTLYNMKLVQATGYLYNCYMFQPQQTPASLKYRAGFWSAIHENPPEVFVVTDQECFSLSRSWALPERWPEFAKLLQDDYTLTEQRTPPHLVAWWRRAAVPYSYRLYVRKGRP